jgi:DNA-binding MarR family transcriptional regulator
VASTPMTGTATAGPAADTQAPASDLPRRRPNPDQPAEGAKAPATATQPGCPVTVMAVTATAGDPPDNLDEAILDAMGTLLGQMLAEGEAISEEFGVPMFCVKALHILDAAMPMKELGQRMRCDPSFVTAIADALEKRGLATREPNTADRRVKNLVLSAAGLDLKRQMEKTMTGRMPWTRALDRSERLTFLALIRKLTEAEPNTAATSTAATSTAGTTASSPATPSGGGRAGEVSDAPDNASAG